MGVWRLDKEKYITVTVDVEEWFHSNWFNVKQVIGSNYHGEYPQTEIVENTKQIISLFDELSIKGTFFILGGTAIKYPEIIDLIKDRDHEIASHGFFHNWNDTSQQTFAEHLRIFKKHVYAHPKGFRFPNYNFTEGILEVLHQEGFLYDSSVVPSFNIPGWYGDPHLPLHPYKYALSNGSLIEFPISVSPYLRVPGAGGWFLRNCGFPWTMFLTYFHASVEQYANIYFHTWEISTKNPSLPGIPFHVFRNTGKPMLNRIRGLLYSWKKKKHYHIEAFEDLLDHEINTTCRPVL